MDGWTDGRMDGWMDGWVGGWVDEWTDGRMDGWMKPGRQLAVVCSRQEGRQAGRQARRQAGRQVVRLVSGTTGRRPSFHLHPTRPDNALGRLRRNLSHKFSKDHLFPRFGCMAECGRSYFACLTSYISM